jgi:hypothetical protein
MILKYITSKITLIFYAYFNEMMFVAHDCVSWNHCRKKFKKNHSVMKYDDIVHSTIF